MRVVIETTRESRNKLALDPKLRLFRLRRVLPEGMNFPYDFGFVPSTLAEDGDPIDVLVLADAPLPTGTVVTVRLIGVIEAEEGAADGRTVRNDRLLAVAEIGNTHAEVTTLGDLRPRLVDEIARFFETYNALDGKNFQVLGQEGPERARALLDEAIARAHDRRE